MISRFSTPLSQQTFGTNPLGISSPPGNMQMPMSPFQNSQQMAGFGGQRYGVNLPQFGGQQMPGLLSGYLDHYKNYRAPYQAPPVQGIDSVGIAYRQRLADEAAAKAALEAAQQQAAVNATGGAPAPAGYVSIGA